MCEIHSEKVIACQLGYYPLGKDNYNKDIEKVIELIENSKLEHQVSSFSTVIKGESKKVFALLNSITDSASKDFVMNITVSNT